MGPAAKVISKQKEITVYFIHNHILVVQTEVYTCGADVSATGGGGRARKQEEYLRGGKGPEALEHKGMSR